MRVLAVGDRVEDLALGHLADAVVVVGGRGHHAVGLGDALAVAQRAMAGGAVDGVALPAALHELLVNHQLGRKAAGERAAGRLAAIEKIIRAEEVGIRGDGAPARHDAGGQRAVGATVGEELATPACGLYFAWRFMSGKTSPAAAWSAVPRKPAIEIVSTTRKAVT